MQASEPERPPGLPDCSEWNPSVDKWEVSQLDERGARVGECLFYRADGTLYSRCRFVDGVQQGPFAIYHPDGRIAREGEFVAGQLEGLVTCLAGDGPEAEPLRACCVPAAATRMLARYREGQVLLEVFYDGGGRPILSDGNPWPPRPSQVPEGAEYHEEGASWALRTASVERMWTAEGKLVEEVELAAGKKSAVRSYDGEGRVTELCQFAPDGRRNGAFLRRLPEAVSGPYSDPAIREERGRYDLGQSVATWTFHAADGSVLRSANRGLPFADDRIASSPAFADSVRDERGLVEQLSAGGRVREALVVAARAAARTGDRARLLTCLASSVVPLAAELEAQRGEALTVAGDATVSSVLDALVGGADAAAAFAALAAALPGTGAAATELVDAALLLAPERRMTHLTRALIRFQRGDEAGALADAAVVEQESASAAASLRGYMAVAFRRFDFPPGDEELAPDPELDSSSAQAAQSLEAIHHAIGVYATRLQRVRAAVRAVIGESAAPPWLPPDTSVLLPGGAVPLRRERVVCDADPGDPEATPDTIEIDEVPETSALGVPALLALAHADWGALSWLCWAAGLDRVALPERVDPPGGLAVAMKLIVTRCWRVHDRLNTGGLLSQANGVPGFVWQGADIDTLPQHLLRMAADEYLSARSMFLWLASADGLSPFQDDLREA